jgi:hypothetical protein
MNNTMKQLIVSFSACQVEGSGFHSPLQEICMHLLPHQEMIPGFNTQFPISSA